jgi:hypothetical protein
MILSLGRGRIDHGLGNFVITTKKRVEVSGELEHVFFRERSTFANDLGTSACKEGMVVTGTILVGGSRE